ncbi:MAG: NAD(P)H-dependent oxidoreductase [Firmicutes bacterium]|nr:NAD(P)H-dependent oxidoreductase [Bacillota bacterium]
MKDIYLIAPGTPSKTLTKMIDKAIGDNNKILIKDESDITNLQNKKLLFAVEINSAGYNISLAKIFTKLTTMGYDSLLGSSAAILTHSESDLYTKTMAQEVIFKANQLGCRFIGRPLVEAIGNLRNFLTMQKVIDKPLMDVCLECSQSLGKRLIEDEPKTIKNPQILVLHASNRKTSNTLMLWDMIHKHLTNYDIKEIHIENGTVLDCIGCPYTTCKHYGEDTSCFYGGIMVEEVYPAILKSDAIIWICPNYNDAISANLTAVINRLTALFRKTRFFNKTLFSIIVSGNSGSDAIAKQLISALNMNKTFRLPPYFSIMSTANDKGAILDVSEIEKKAKAFARNISKEIKA